MTYGCSVLHPWGQPSTQLVWAKEQTSGPGNQDLLQCKDEHGFLSSHALVCYSLMVLRVRPFPSKLKKLILLKKPLDWQTYNLLMQTKHGSCSIQRPAQHEVKWKASVFGDVLGVQIPVQPGGVFLQCMAQAECGLWTKLRYLNHLCIQLKPTHWFPYMISLRYADEGSGCQSINKISLGEGEKILYEKTHQGLVFI